METQVRTPQSVFMQPQRLIVPLFQRPYVWNEENQWEPLWQDISRVATRLLANPERPPFPHFLGAVVLQQVQNPVGSMQERVIIDGQQRLTTLQLMLDALHAEFESMGARQPASRVETLVCNQEAFWDRPEDRYKVWPTNRDRAAFNAVMSAEAPVDYSTLVEPKARMVLAHKYFGEQARGWIDLNGTDEALDRATALERAVRELLQVVVIDLAPDENAQEIFETLNARGAQLTAADLIKNFIFQRLMEAGEDVEAIYEQQWKEFETGFWETEIASGRVRYARSAIFLNQWLIARTGEEIVAREVFSRFKRYAEFDSELPMPRLVDRVHRTATVYRSFLDGAETKTGPLDRVELFAYRTSVLESEVIKPFILWLLDPDEPEVPRPQLIKALEAAESWMVRRMLVRATTKAYNQVIAELITQMRKGDRAIVGDIVENYFRAQPGASRYWPDDDELRRELRSLLAYRRLRRGRLRMVLEAIEDHCRGWVGEEVALGGERVPRAQLTIEHVMPRQWRMHWPFAGTAGELERDGLIHTVGNLTLLTHRLNSHVSNGPWLGENGKQGAIKKSDVLLLNRDLLQIAADDWTDDKIAERTARLTEAIIEIWPVPAGHHSVFAEQVARGTRRIELADLINAGLIEAGQMLYARIRNPRGLTATVLSDGSLDVDGAIYQTPSAAAAAIAGKHENGWWYFLVEKGPPRKALRRVWREYVEQLTVDVDEDEEGLDDEDDA